MPRGVKRDPAPTMHPLKSSAVQAIGYDAPSKVLRVQFTSGATYEFPDIGPDAFDAFKAAKSAGTHFAQHFRGRKGKRLET